MKDLSNEPASLLAFWLALWPLVQYRVPMKVTEVMVFPNARFYVCPRCKVTLEREFVNCCDRCGQVLDWHDCEKSKIIYPKVHKQKDSPV